LSGSEMFIPTGVTGTYNPTISGNTFTGGTDAVVLKISILTQNGSGSFTFSPTVSNNTSFSGQSNDAIRISLGGNTLSGSATLTFQPQVQTNAINTVTN